LARALCARQSVRWKQGVSDCLGRGAASSPAARGRLAGVLLQCERQQLFGRRWKRL